MRMDLGKTSHVSEAVQLGKGYLLRSITHAFWWHFITEEGIESTVEIIKGKAKWKDYNLQWEKRREIENYLMPEGASDQESAA